ncbi:flotillin domain-containing protein, partial [Dokdonella sp.]|uniref:flotillin domain-containing protein n=1 Tax=Dokdonella sp. TaxID=2291710 RepID=UPI003BAEBD77
PMERIEGIKIIDVRGMNGAGAGAADTGGGGERNLACSVVDHALRYRAQRPLVDALLKEVGLDDLTDLSGLVAGSVTGTERPNEKPDGRPTGATPRPND